MNVSQMEQINLMFSEGLITSKKIPNTGLNSGIGLFLSNFLAKSLYGKKDHGLQFTSLEGHGTIFSFEITMGKAECIYHVQDKSYLDNEYLNSSKVILQENNSKNVSVKTIEDVYYNQGMKNFRDLAIIKSETDQTSIFISQTQNRKVSA